MHHAGLWVNGGLHLHLHMCKVINLSLKSSDPFYRLLHLVNAITDVSVQRSTLVKVPGRGGDSDSKARLRVPLRGVITTTLMVTWVATPIPSVPLALLRVSQWCSRGLLCCLQASSPTSVRFSYEAMVHLSHPIELQCKTFTRVQSKARVR
jgi:hypothetical protein